MDSPEKPHDAKVLQQTRRAHVNITAPGVLRSDAPEKNKKVHNMRRVQRCSNLTARCGRAGRWCWMSRQELCSWCARGSVGVRGGAVSWAACLQLPCGMCGDGSGLEEARGSHGTE
ncbi:hypothetical protein ERJ75_001176000 [Trypanosoma vivax]|nr:hypothetical protein ERJ75_001176000 [Trypanosoma vivax]